MIVADLSNLVVEVLHNRGDDNRPDWSVGSGFFVGRRLVLTALHNVDGPGELLVRVHGTEEHPAVVRLQGDKNFVDLAVLEVPDVEVDIPPLRYGAVDQGASAMVERCWAVGFPRFKERVHEPKPLRLSAQVNGEIPTAENLDQPLLTLQVRRSPRPLPSSTVRESEWAGMSGATVFSRNNIIVGVITEHHLPEGESTLTVVPITAIEQQLPEAEATKWWKLLGVNHRALVRLPDEAPSPPSHEQERLWNVRYSRNRFFTGRKKLLKQLHDNLTKRKAVALTQAISGLGGIGKTQTAVEYAYRYRGDYQYVLWVNAASRETLIKDFGDLAGRLNLPEKNEQNPNITIEAMKGWLGQHDHWLLLADGADEPSLVNDFLPRSHKGHILLTTRQDPDPSAKKIDVDVMDKNEGMTFLLRRASVLRLEDPLSAASETDRVAAEKIVEEMGRLPLALDQAGAYIQKTKCGVPGYLTSYRKRQTDLLKWRESTGEEYQETVDTTWSLSFQQVEKDNPMAADLLWVCASLAPDVIPEEIFVNGALELGSRFEPLADDATLIDEPIGVLRAYSLVKRDPEEHTLSIHRLVQAVLKENMKGKQIYREWAQRTVRAVNRAFPSFPDVPDITLWKKYEPLLPHALACADLIKEQHFTFPEARRLLYETGRYLFTRAQYSQAESLYQQDLNISEQVPGTGYSETARTLHALGWLYRALDRYDKAEWLLKEALEIRKKVLADTASILHELAWPCKDQRKHEQAESLLRKALEIRKQVLEPEDPQIADSLHTLAWFLQDQGGYQEAEPLYQRALEIRKQVLKPEDPQIADSLHALAWLLQDQGGYQEAEPLYQRALAIREQALGSEHPWTAETLHAMGQLNQAQGRYQKAESLYQRALAIREKMLGTKHPQVADSLHALAWLNQIQGRDQKAERLYQQALNIVKQQLGSGHPTTVTVQKSYDDLVRGMKQKRKEQH